MRSRAPDTPSARFVGGAGGHAPATVADETDREELGERAGRQGPWAEPDVDNRAGKQQGEPEALEVEGDPRGGLQSEDYRLADPREVVTEGDVGMAGPAGAPQEGKSVEQRRAESNAWREGASAFEDRPVD